MTDELFMKVAIENAKIMKGQTGKNPVVGCILVKEGRVVGIGSHLKEGEPHAEIHALQVAGEQAKGATAYVTLEPCSHKGRTGSCALALIQAGLKRVVVATLDPNPLVSGRGIQILKEAGIAVDFGICGQEAEQMNEVFNYSITKKLPFITLKAAISLDGKIATKTAHSKWITSADARSEVHQLRSEHQGIIVGVETVLKDNPALTARIENGRNPIRIVVDSQLRTPLDAQLVTDRQVKTYIFTSAAPTHSNKEAAFNAHGITVVKTGLSDRVDLLEMLTFLYQNGIGSALLEAGGTLNAAFLNQQLVQKLIVYIAPKLVGGASARSFYEGEGITSMTDAIELKWQNSCSIGPDLKLIAYPQYKEKN